MSNVSGGGVPGREVSGEALYQWRQWALETAHPHQIDPGEVDWLLQSMTALSATDLRLSSYRQKLSVGLNIPLVELTAKWQQRLSKGVPVQYLAGETPWRNFSLAVSPAVLIPRPETELIVEIAKERASHSPIASALESGHWTDVGTGSGAIALGLAHLFPQATIHAVDISLQALAIAQKNVQKNAQKYRLTGRIHFYHGRWLEPLLPLQGQLAGIVTNPPYIPSHTIPTLQREVTDHEPHLALDGGPDGLECIRELVSAGSKYLRPGGLWLSELMAGQAEAVKQLLAEQGSYKQILIHRDLAGVERFVSAYKAL